jgi:aminopeptidase
VAAPGLDERIERYAEIAVHVGANVQPGQIVFVVALVEHMPLARAFARAAYRAGARYVDIYYVDNHVKHALVELGPDEALDCTPPWLLEKWKAMGAERGAGIATTGDPEPDLMADLDGERVGRARMKEISEVWMSHMHAALVNWTGLAFPTEGWARQIFGEPDLERLWEAVAFCTRLDEPDPVGAWRMHMSRLERRAEALNALGLDAGTGRT